MRISFYGHSCFAVDNGKIKLGIDPYPADFGYFSPIEELDILLISHNHFDHNAVNNVKKVQYIVRGPGRRQIRGVKIIGKEFFHDENKGKDRGKVVLFKFIIDDIIFLHSSDLGYIPNTDDEFFKDIDILFLNIGGVYALNAYKATELLNKIQPKITIPMHYKTNRLLNENINLHKIDAFLQLNKGRNIEFIDRMSFILKDKPLNKKIIILKN